MKYPSRVALVFSLLLVLQPDWSDAQASPLERVGNSTLRMPSTLPTYGFALTNAFGGLTFTDPVAVLSPPGETNRLFVVEQRGRVAVITNLAAPNRSVFLDVSSRVLGGTSADERGLLGMAFHPGYATNGCFYIYYSLNATSAAGVGLHEQLSRFLVSAADPNVAEPGSELALLTMYDQAANHNGGDLHFGPDGFLYLSLGDEGAGNDTLNNSQRINKDFWSSMLRLDVDTPSREDSLLPNAHPANTNGPGGAIHYRIPADNPFVGATSFLGVPLEPASVRTEMYAVGLRNPWRFSFDPGTGLLYCGDVGQDRWEEIDILTKGGNYGWAFREGNVAGPKAAPPGFSSQPPLLTYFHGGGTNQGFSVTGGVVYRGARIPALNGAYVFADYVAGNVWFLRSEGTNTPGWVWMLREAGIAGFGVDPSNGDVLAADQSEDTIKRLVQVATSAGEALPPTLGDTGAFADLELLTPNRGLVPYDVNVPFWSDHAIKTRWAYVSTNFNLTFQPQNPWLFPTGSVWVKHFELELTNGVPASRRRVETRLLVRYAGPNQTDLYGVTYRWGDSATNAVLVPDAGMDEPFLVDDGGGVVRTQVWHYPGRNECLQCHTRVAGWVLGFNTTQLNRDFSYGAGVVENQLLALSRAGYFTRPITNLYSLRALAPPDDESISVEQRVRSYFAANCAQCHQPGGSGQGVFDARLFASLASSRLINGPLNDTGGDADARLVVPGSLEHSMVLKRASQRGPGQMPPLASTVTDPQALALLSRWITNELSGYRTFAQWQTANFGSDTLPEAQASADPDGDGANNFNEYLTGTNPTNRLDFWSIGLGRTGQTLQLGYPRLANRRIEIQWSTNLLDSAGWQFLHVPENRPFFSASNGLWQVPDVPADVPGKFYRGRVLEP